MIEKLLFQTTMTYDGWLKYRSDVNLIEKFCEGVLGKRVVEHISQWIYIER